MEGNTLQRSSSKESLPDPSLKPLLFITLKRSTDDFFSPYDGRLFGALFHFSFKKAIESGTRVLVFLMIQSFLLSSFSAALM